MQIKSHSHSFYFFFKKVMQSVFFALLLIAFTTDSVKAWDIWLVTNNRRIIVIRNVENSPTQEFIVLHDLAPNSANDDFGDIGFAPDGSLYGISMGYGNNGDATLSAINLSDGSLTTAGNPFTFEWGNALAFDFTTGRGYTGGGLEHFSPYEHIKRFRYFDNYDPGTESIWHDMSGDYPNGGFAGDFAFANNKAYAIWGIQYWHWNGVSWQLIEEHYLLEITLDASKNFISYINLGQTEPLIGEGIWGLASDGQTLYATTPTALYRVDNMENGTATYTHIINYALNVGENVNGASSIWTDLEINHTVNNPTPYQNTEIILTTTIHNQGPYDANTILAEITLPAGYEYLSSNPSTGSYNSATGEWSLGSLPLGATETLTITVVVHELGILESQAEITFSNQGDPDSHPHTSFAVDDISDGIADDDEATATVTSLAPAPESLPATGFQRGAVSNIPPQPASQAYTETQMLLSIPKLGVEMPIVGVPQSKNGWDVTWLGNSAGYLAGSAFPTWAGNTVITGHVWDAFNRPGAFAQIKSLKYGDQVQIHAWGLVYTYEVRESKLVTAKNVNAVLESNDYDWLTLVTCEFYNPFTGNYLFRRSVRAVLVSIH